VAHKLVIEDSSKATSCIAKQDSLQRAGQQLCVLNQPAQDTVSLAMLEFIHSTAVTADQSVEAEDSLNTLFCFARSSLIQNKSLTGQGSEQIILIQLIHGNPTFRRSQIASSCHISISVHCLQRHKQLAIAAVHCKTATTGTDCKTKPNKTNAKKFIQLTTRTIIQAKKGSTKRYMPYPIPFCTTDMQLSQLTSQLNCLKSQLV